MNKEGRKREFYSNDRIDAMLRSIYQLKGYTKQADRKGIPTLKAYAKQIGWSPTNLARRARELGLPKARDNRLWTDKEDSILQNNAKRSPASIQSMLRTVGFCRSLSAIRARLTLMNYRLATWPLSPREVGMHLGYEDGFKVISWIRNGFLRATIRDGHDDKYWVYASDLRAFILRNPMMIQLNRVEQLWFFQLMFPDELLGSVKSILKGKSSNSGFQRKTDYECQNGWDLIFVRRYLRRRGEIGSEAIHTPEGDIQEYLAEHGLSLIEKLSTRRKQELVKAHNEQCLAY